MRTPPVRFSFVIPNAFSTCRQVILTYLGNMYELYICNGVEAAMVIILGSIPVLRPLVERVYPSPKGSKATSQYSYGSRGKFTKFSTPSQATDSSIDPHLLSRDPEHGQQGYALSTVPGSAKY
jgi:hypothetical protein